MHLSITRLKGLVLKTSNSCLSMAQDILRQEQDVLLFDLDKTSLSKVLKASSTHRISKLDRLKVVLHKMSRRVSIRSKKDVF